MKGDLHARICEGLRVKLPRSTRCLMVEGIELRKTVCRGGRHIQNCGRQHHFRLLRKTEVAPPESETMALSGGICVNVGYPHRSP